jgi:hypothetical protein
MPPQRPSPEAASVRRADAAAEAAAQIVQPSRRHREQFQQRRGGAPHRIGRATTMCTKAIALKFDQKLILLF